MAITTDSYYDIIKDGITLDRIGLSKTLDNYTIEEIADYAFVGSYSQIGKQIMPKSESGWTYVGYSQNHGSCPFAASFHSGTYEKIDIEDGQTTDYNFTENGIYRKVILLHDTTGVYHFNLTDADIPNMKVITEFDAPKYTIDFGTKNSMKKFGTDYWMPVSESSKYNTHLGHNDNEQISTCGIAAYIIIEYNSTYYFIRANILDEQNPLFAAADINNSYASSCAFQLYDYQGNSGTRVGIAESVITWAQNSDFSNEAETPIVQDLSVVKNYWSLIDGYCSLISFVNKGFTQYFMFTEEYNLLLYIAGCYGLHFVVDGTIYKPLISDNFVVGYSDDLTVASDLDSYIGSTKHTMPITPPGPTPPGPTPGDNPWDAIESAGAFGGALQFVRSYYISGTELANLKTYMGKTEEQGGPPNGYDMLDSIIGLKMYPFALGSSADDSITVSLTNPGSTWTEIMRNNFIAQVCKAITGEPWPGGDPPQIRIINTGCHGHATDAAMRNYSLGTIDMSSFHNGDYPFLDYDASVELYLPFVGTFTLDTQTVMNATLKAYLNLDPATGGVYAYCYANKGGSDVMIASGTGNIGVDIPISSAQAGVLRAQIDAIRSQQAAALVTTVASLAAPTVTIAATGAAASSAISNAAILGVKGQELAGLAANAARDSAKAAMRGAPVISGELASVATNALTANRQVKNLTSAHNMAMTGSIGASVAEWSCPWTAFVKIIRPRAHKPGSNYNHSVAVPTYTSGKLSQYPGLTVCINPDTSGISKATPTERNAIAAMLNGGVIV